jgi:hypothetical protein
VLPSCLIKSRVLGADLHRFALIDSLDRVESLGCASRSLCSLTTVHALPECGMP